LVWTLKAEGRCSRGWAEGLPRAWIGGRGTQAFPVQVPHARLCDNSLGNPQTLLPRGRQSPPKSQTWWPGHWGSVGPWTSSGQGVLPWNWHLTMSSLNSPPSGSPVSSCEHLILAWTVLFSVLGWKPQVTILPMWPGSPQLCSPLHTVPSACLCPCHQPSTQTWAGPAHRSLRGLPPPLSTDRKPEP
jgi:hypothetical protein